VSRNFDGVDDYLKLVGLVYGPVSPRTLSFWINCYNPVPQTFSGRIFSERNNNGFIFVTGSGNVITLFNSGIVTAITVTSENNSLKLNTWQNVTATWDGSTTATNVHIYFNGKETATYRALTNGNTLSSSDAGASTFGIEGSLVTTTVFKGLMAHAQLFNRVLSIGEIQQSMFVPGSIRKGLLRYFPLYGQGPRESNYTSTFDFATTNNGVTASSSNPPINSVFTIPRPELMRSF